MVQVSQVYTLDNWEYVVDKIIGTKKSGINDR
jgi:hypothetical protein